MEKAFVSWSGGKETSLACYKTMQNQDIKTAYLLNMVSEDGKHSRSHGVSSTLLRVQADALDIPIIQRRTTWGSYERVFKKAVSGLKKKGVEVGIFGDIDLQEHRDWVERVCKEAEIKPLLPLWGEDREGLLKEFIRTGFKAIVVATKANLLGKEWLGREVNKKFIEDLKRLGNIDPGREELSNGASGVDLCGEKGEYHTFVYDGPIFKRPVKFAVGRKIFKDKHWLLEIIPESE